MAKARRYQLFGLLFLILVVLSTVALFYAASNNGLSLLQVRNIALDKIEVTVIESGQILGRGTLGPKGKRLFVFFLPRDGTLEFRCKADREKDAVALRSLYVTPGLLYYSVRMDGCRKMIL